MVEKQSTQESFNLDELEFTPDNIINWLKFISDFAPLDKDIKDRINKFIKRTDKARRYKEMEDIFG